MTDAKSQQQHCPLCGQPNQCALSADPKAKDCWCFHTDIPPRVLQAIPEEQRGQRCICPQCAKAAGQLAYPLP